MYIYSSSCKYNYHVYSTTFFRMSFAYDVIVVVSCQSSLSCSIVLYLLLIAGVFGVYRTFSYGLTHICYRNIISVFDNLRQSFEYDFPKLAIIIAFNYAYICYIHTVATSSGKKSIQINIHIILVVCVYPFGHADCPLRTL